MNGVERLYNRETGEESWTFELEGVRHNCEKWDEVIAILHEHKLAQKAKGVRENLSCYGYGTGTYNGD